MEYITEEQFSEQPKEIQKVFLEWWKPSVGDLYCNIYNNQQDNVLVINNCQIEFSKSFTEDIKKFGYPLLTEGQLRKFIEDELERIHYENDGRRIELDILHNNNFTTILEGVMGSEKGIKRVEWVFENELGKKYNLLQVYWKVALELAKQEVNIND
jgi:hypothetical protein